MKKKILMSSLIKDKTITLLMNNNSGNIKINKLMNALKNEKDENKNKVPLSLKNIHNFKLKKTKEKDEISENSVKSE